jgi:hypothetical protein
MGKEAGFDGDHVNQCYVMTMVKSLDGNTLVCEYDVDIKIEGKIDVKGQTEGGPYLALLLCAES